MSISSEITRISGNVSDALTAIANKGVTVPSGSNSDDLATLIAAIETGGGGNAYTRTVVCPQQTVTPTSNGTYYAATLTGATALVAGDDYIVTFDDTEWYCTCCNLWNTYNLLGDQNYMWDNVDQPYPFCVIWESGTTYTLVVNSATSRTVKVEKIVLSGSPMNLTTKTITQNGTYDAEDDSADGYSSVTVNVAGGASNIVTGTFKGTTTGAAMDVNLNYSGSGYPIAVMIFPSNANADTFQSTIQRYAVRDIMLEKYKKATTPTYSGTGDADSCAIVGKYKSSASNAGSYSNAGSTNVTAKLYADEAAGNTLSTLVKIRSNKKLSVYIASSSYGFMANIEYSYVVLYSS